MTINNPIYDHNKTSYRLFKRNNGDFNWLFIGGGPGADAIYFSELINTINPPGKSWLVDFPESGCNKLGSQFDEDFNFERWSHYLIDTACFMCNTILVGHSFSGKYILMHPELNGLVKGIVIMNSSTGYWIDNASKKAKKHNLPSFDYVLTQFLKRKDLASFLEAIEIFCHYYFAPSNVEKGKQTLLSKPFNFYALHWWLTKASSIDNNNLLIPQCPTLVLGGDNDCAVPFEGWFKDERYHQKNIIIHCIENSYHFPWLDQPNFVYQQAHQFIEKICSVA